jgi:hypothetical protein
MPDQLEAEPWKDFRLTRSSRGKASVGLQPLPTRDPIAFTKGGDAIRRLSDRHRRVLCSCSRCCAALAARRFRPPMTDFRVNLLRGYAKSLLQQLRIPSLC